MTDCPIIIAGGGIAGLATARAIQLRGFDIRVFESARSFGSVGAGLTVQPNGMLALRRLGLDVPVIERGVPVEHASIVDQNGRVISDLRLRDWSADIGAPTIAIKRSELQRILLDAVGSGRVAAGISVLDFSAQEAAVVVQLSARCDCRGAALIGCDGLNSTVRRRLLNDNEPRYAGYTSWRGLCPLGPFPGIDRLCEVWGRGFRFGRVPVNDDTVYWFAVASRPPGEADPDNDAKPGLLRACAGWRVPAAEIIEATPSDEILRTDIRDRAPTRRWGLGLVTLAGDAAHPMTPDLAQGASQALEDAVVLADRLARAPSITQAFRDYERSRYRRAARVTRLSRRFGRVAQIDSAPACLVRNALLRMTPAWIISRQTRAMWRLDRKSWPVPDAITGRSGADFVGREQS